MKVAVVILTFLALFGCFAWYTHKKNKADLKAAIERKEQADQAEAVRVAKEAWFAKEIGEAKKKGDYDLVRILERQRGESLYGRCGGCGGSGSVAALDGASAVCADCKGTGKR